MKNNDKKLNPDQTEIDLSLSESAQDTAHRNRKQELGKIVSTCIIVVTVITMVTLVLFSLWLSAFRVTGDQMSPTLKKSELVIAAKREQYDKGDVIAFYHNNDILIKRVAAIGGDTVSMDETGALYVNEVKVNEPYIVNQGLGDCDISFPYKIPDGRVFVLGDNRTESADSRLKQVGSVSDMLIIGKVMVSVWPLTSIGIVE